MTVTTQVRTIQVSFSEPVSNPPGDSDPDDVTHPGNYLLVSAGPDRSFDTDQCGSPLGDDQAVAVTVSYDEPSATATLTPTAALADDLYRLFVCGSTSISIHDLAGNVLDGDGDGTGGDDFVLGFRIDASNLFENGHFDCGLDGWTLTSTNPSEIVSGPDDFEGSNESGPADQLDVGDVVDGGDLGLQLRGEAAQVEGAVGAAPQGQAADRDVVDGSHLDQRRRGVGRHSTR